MNILFLLFATLQSVASCRIISRARISMLSSLAANDPPTAFNKIVLSGFISKASNFCDQDVFNKIFKAGFTPAGGSGSGKMFSPASTTSCRMITAVADDIPFARKRLVSPKSVYSGLVDVLQFSDNLADALSGQDAWIAFNVSSADIYELAGKAIESGIKRVVFTVQLAENECSRSDLKFEESSSILKSAGIQFTFLKHGRYRDMEESKFPYRVVRGSLPIPEAEAHMLSSGDLMRIVTEVLDIPKTFGSVYGIGPGTKVDTEILVYMKSQGWPERVHVVYSIIHCPLLCVHGTRYKSIQEDITAEC
jgi:hypothetical protein